MATLTRTDKLVWAPSAGAASYDVTLENAGGATLNGPVNVTVPEITALTLAGPAPDGRRSPDATFPNITLALAPPAVTGFQVLPI